MLRRLTIGLFTLACAAAVAACSSGNTTVPSSGGQPGIGPNPPTNTVYVSNTSQNAIELFAPSPGPNATPQYVIGGGSTSMNGPFYMAFDSTKHLYVGNYGAATKQGSVLLFQTYATGNVLPFGTVALATGQQPHGIAMLLNNAGFAVASTEPGAFFTSAISLYAPFTSGSTFVTNTIAGSNTNLNNPIGIAVDAKNRIYAANSGGANVTVYPLPTPVPSGAPTPTPSPTPTPTTSPTTSPSGSPSPTPTPSSLNIAPAETITCVPGAGMPSPCMVRPAGLTLDGSGNLYVTDPDSAVAPAIYIFAAAQVACGAPPCTLGLTPARFISGSNTKLVDPTDVAVDSSGTTYVIDAGNGPNAGKLLIFSATANGNVAPSTTISLPAGSATGLALSP